MSGEDRAARRRRERDQERAGITPEDARYTAALMAMLGRTGARSVDVRWSDDQVPTVWFGVAHYTEGRWETAAGQTPRMALVRLCEAVIDGGVCTHCQRPTGFVPDLTDGMPMEEHVCWFMWDPELSTFRRGCE